MRGSSIRPELDGTWFVSRFDKSRAGVARLAVCTFVVHTEGDAEPAQSA